MDLINAKKVENIKTLYNIYIYIYTHTHTNTHTHKQNAPFLIFKFFCLLHVSNPRVHLQKDGCIYSYSIVRSICISISSLVKYTLLRSRTIFGEDYKSLSSSLCSFLHSPVTSSLFDPNILLNTTFSNDLSLRSSLKKKDQVSND